MARHSFILVCAVLCIFLAVLFFGLSPKGYDFSNHVSWIAGGPGIRFDKYGVVYTELENSLLQDINGRDGFSILMVFQSGRLDNNGSGHILTLHAGNDRNQLVVWQWFSHIIAMNDNDYAHRRKTGRVSAKIPSSPAQEIHLSLTTGKNGTTLYFDGQAVSSNHDLVLDFPAGIRTTLVIGNSVYGNGPWKGKISGLALIGRELPPESIASLADAWMEKRSLADVENEDPALLYLFNENEGTRIIDRAGGAMHLQIPRRATPIRKRVLAETSGDFGLTGSLARDALVNFAGFFPFGFFLTAVLTRIVRVPEKRSAVYAVIICFAVSLAIEALQVWIPSRSSQFLDLLLNTAGAFAGAFLSMKTVRKSTGSY